MSRSGGESGVDRACSVVDLDFQVRSPHPPFSPFLAQPGPERVYRELNPMRSANLDASNPRPLKTLRAELEVQERARNRDKEDAGRARQAFVNAVCRPLQHDNPTRR